MSRVDYIINNMRSDVSPRFTKYWISKTNDYIIFTRLLYDMEYIIYVTKFINRRVHKTFFERPEIQPGGGKKTINIYIY